jgi:hypothetical protein
MNINIRKAKNWPKSFFAGLVLSVLVVLALPLIIIFILFAGLFGFIAINENKEEKVIEDGNMENKEKNKVDGKTFLAILKEFRGIMKDAKQQNKDINTTTNTTSTIR